ncbi:hypothetical protein MSG28_003289 [Choristoneura fumiferana]|uniref:Uncharacterized protein n=1 Tax=Choristoneura fumiferana TaxID=7141 RepID=A0ACC0KE86_CHOFU|nr:hypothetical protein MSG28_003289 [Choristoneura fumiferana]
MCRVGAPAARPCVKRNVACSSRQQKKIMILVCLLILGLVVVGYVSSYFMTVKQRDNAARTRCLQPTWKQQRRAKHQ